MRQISAAADSPSSDSGPSVAGDRLERRLQTRHLTMIALGGALGAGLFVGSGEGIRGAGPAILISFVAAALIVTAVMRMLGEMSAAAPQSGSFSVYAEQAFGRTSGFAVGWMYWWYLTVTLAIESTGSARLLNAWVPQVPQWAFALAAMALFTATNLLTVRVYGESEFWFAGLKVFAIVAFLVLGVLAVAGVLPGVEAPGTSNLLGHGGFAPHGWTGMVTGLFAVFFAFGSMEIATIAAAESQDPARSVARAIRTIVWRLVLFYLLSIAIIVSLVPWNSPAVEVGPFAATLDHLGIPAAATVMDIVVLVALLSALNTNLYGASRMAYSLAGRRKGPRALTAVTAGGVPRRAVLASSAFGFFAVLLNVWWPHQVFRHLINSAGALLLFVWLAIAATQLVLRRRYEREAPQRLVLRMWGFPQLTWLTIAAMVAVLLIVLINGGDDARMQLLSSAVVVVALFLIGGIWSRTQSKDGDITPVAGAVLPGNGTGFVEKADLAAPAVASGSSPDEAAPKVQA